MTNNDLRHVELKFDFYFSAPDFNPNALCLFMARMANYLHSGILQFGGGGVGGTFYYYYYYL